MKNRIFVLALVICLFFTSFAFGAVEKPGKVKNVKAEGDYGCVQITYDKVAGATGYKIYYSEDEDFGYKSITGYNGKIYLDANKTYYFKVRAYKKVSGKTYYGTYSDVVMATTKEKDPNFYFGCANINYSNDIDVFFASYESTSHPITVDLYSFMLYDSLSGKLLTTFSPYQYVIGDTSSNTTTAWKNVDILSCKLVNEEVIGIALKAQYGYTKPDLNKHTLVYTGEYNGKKYLFKTNIEKTAFVELDWMNTTITTNYNYF
jgi:hypothetical protein